MCVAIRFNSADGDMYFARNLDGSNPMGERPLALASGYPLEWEHMGVSDSRHAIVGAGHVFDGKLILHEAGNDAGLGVIGLALPKSTHDAPVPIEGKLNISRYEFPAWVAANFETVAQVEEALRDAAVVDPSFGIDIDFNPFPMHWLVVDASGSLVVESTEHGLEMYRDDADVLTNEPAFPEQRAGLQSFLDAHPAASASADGAARACQPSSGHPAGFPENCQGVNLSVQDIPGDFSSPSRFVKAAYINALYPAQESEHENVVRAFRTLETVAVPLGAVPAADGRLKTTQYRCVFSASARTYYYAAYDDLSVRSLCLDDLGREGVLQLGLD